ncbi:MAG: M2 family metallopeptidase [Pirellulales bacterium]|nr:M2 family metallopeptidase [Pirellulales bacterium]
MKSACFVIVAFAGLAAAAGAAPAGDIAEEVALAMNDATAPATSEKDEIRQKATSLLAEYEKELARLDTAAALASWEASATGAQEAFDESAATALALRTFHSDPERYRRILALLKHKDDLDPTDARALEVARLDFEGNQLPPDLLKAMVELSTEITKTFNTHRSALGGKRVTDNDLLERMAGETDGGQRKAIWEAMKQVGGAVGPKLVELAKLRNEAARKLGYRNYWDMMVCLQEQDPARLLAIFAELEKVTDEPFRKMKRSLDAELAPRFGIEPADMMPWHYDNPFFQSPPPSDKVDLDEFYKNKKKEDIVELARAFYAGIGLPIEDIIARSDLYEREGKDQHAFSTNIDREGDVRTLLNIKPTAEWMDTMLHEAGHAVYDKYIDPSLPFNLREPAHTFTTEGIAMFFGALAKNPGWIVEFAGTDADRVKKLAKAIREQRRREQLLFARWTLVMLHFEKALYDNPDQDLNKLWWDYAERYQLLKRPPGRDEPDWASKTHFTVAPVYYHNYQLGELFAAQLRAAMARQLGHEGPAETFKVSDRKDVGQFLKEKVFAPGALVPWPEFVRRVTGEPLGAACFADEVQPPR